MKVNSVGQNSKRIVFVCVNDNCRARGSDQIYKELVFRCGGLEGIEVREYICFGNCDSGANSVVFPDRIWFSGLRDGGASAVMEYLTHGTLARAHTDVVDPELADTTWELLDLELADEEGVLDLAPDQREE